MLLLNPNVGLSMSDLEVLARKGCPAVQATIEKECLKLAQQDKVARTVHSMNRHEMQRELRTHKAKRFSPNFLN